MQIAETRHECLQIQKIPTSSSHNLQICNNIALNRYSLVDHLNNLSFTEERAIRSNIFIDFSH